MVCVFNFLSEITQFVKFENFLVIYKIFIIQVKKSNNKNESLMKRLNKTIN